MNRTRRGGARAIFARPSTGSLKPSDDAKKAVASNVCQPPVTHEARSGPGQKRLTARQGWERARPAHRLRPKAMPRRVGRGEPLRLQGLYEWLEHEALVPFAAAAASAVEW